MKAVAILAALSLAGSATVPAQGSGPTAGFGQAAQIDGLRIRPLSIVEDSRCPANVQCVWAGRLVIFAEVDLSGGSETFRGNLTLGEPLALGRETVTLVAAVPGKSAATPTDPRAYRFTFAVGAKP
jgi:hypothetical protein